MPEQQKADALALCRFDKLIQRIADIEEMAVGKKELMTEKLDNVTGGDIAFITVAGDAVELLRRIGLLDDVDLLDTVPKEDEVVAAAIHL